VNVYGWLLPLHLLLIGLWLGCVLTEALFERALLGQGRAQELILTRLHKRVDLFIEIPAFVGVLLTGGAMLVHAPASAWLHAKVGFGLLAIAANAYCVVLVWRRARLAEQGLWAEFEEVDHQQHAFGAVVLVAMLVALGLGLYVYGLA
jgi:uncharacterized membrane protein